MKDNSFRLSKIVPRPPFLGCLLFLLLIFIQVSSALDMGDLDKLYTDPPQGKRYKIGYVLDKTSITKKGDGTYNIRISAITKEQTAVILMDVNCRKKLMAYGCLEVHEGDTNRILKRSNECGTGYGPFKAPAGDMKHVVDAFCKRYDKETASSNLRPSDKEIRAFFAKCMKDYGSSKTCRGEARVQYGISEKEVWSALGLREGEY